MIVARRQYKRIKYMVFKYNKTDKLQKLAQIENKDPKAFWTGVKKIISPLQETSHNIDPDSWVVEYHTK